MIGIAAENDENGESGKDIKWRQNNVKPFEIASEEAGQIKVGISGQGVQDDGEVSEWVAQDGGNLGG